MSTFNRSTYSQSSDEMVRITQYLRNKQRKADWVKKMNSGDIKDTGKSNAELILLLMVIVGMAAYSLINIGLSI